MPIQTEVLIVGGSLNGLTAALLLAHHGIGCLAVERHPDTPIQYKFAGISPRSMEIYRSLGIEEEIRAKRTGDQQAGGVARAKNLADPDIQWMRAHAWPDVEGLSPTPPATCDQHVLEPILRAHAQRLGADVRFNTEFISFEQDNQTVRARIRHRATGKEEDVVAEYVIAADGADGTTREKLGIPRHGPGVLQHWMNIIFDTDLPPTLQGKPLTSCFVTDLNGTFTPRENGRWLLALQYFPERGDRPVDFDANYCRELVRRGAGEKDVKADVVDVRPWEVAAFIAERFRKGRVFLVGDAAHVMPPTGAFGGNTGIHDAHNLAWKLAAVLKGAADASLVDSYDSERRPVAEHSLEQALARLQAWFKDPGQRLPSAVAMAEDYDVVFGQRYDGGALIAEHGARERAFENARGLSARPGTRAPHLWVERDGRRISILDLFGKKLVLLTGTRGSSWCEAAQRIAGSIRFHLDCCRVGGEGDVTDVEHRWPGAYDIDEDGAVLVRPDGFVAWRSRNGPAEPERVLNDVLARIASESRYSPQ
ncbi:MAG: Polyketide hydroxylase WhiE VIII [Nitrospira sp.]|jgi:2-polyprenyl-6-methoxyphenol hydroxylase-like FAD-dependent oxidoreductase|nr:MAG: Polyketide hydroxylase WhiE VIII [Nitrospira sp.]